MAGTNALAYFNGPSRPETKKRFLQDGHQLVDEGPVAVGPFEGDDLYEEWSGNEDPGCRGCHGVVLDWLILEHRSEEDNITDD